jgi:hypothetical protein
VVCVLGGRVADGDFEAEGLELAEVAADLAVAVAVEVVPVGAEVGEAGFGVVEEVPDDECDTRSYADFSVMPTRRREYPAGRDDGQERSA